MKVVATLLILVGICGFGVGTMMFGDIGVAAIIGSVVGILSGIGFFSTAKAIKNAAIESSNNREPPRAREPRREYDPQRDREPRRDHR